jgi:hypothetical protein
VKIDGTLPATGRRSISLRFAKAGLAEPRRTRCPHRPPTDLTQLDSWFRAARGVTFDDDRSSSDHRRRLYAALGPGADCSWRHWLAIDRGRPVGTASALFTDAVALEHIGVIPEHRSGRGSAGCLMIII